ncbi:MAG: hypothetical protein DWQ47_13915 [Acidobacteria bacterium]|nr:MAG: hypothetical protein DWQ32_01315 [Acidobacteriota bacterium]REK02834.1 MAG: hypothetical protein DWQ38_10820 [Acidobacteriota bacterium]REK13362.1 MAG: hypothetical protein DWQ43_07005 [Acidobacteriota bacterium]REK41356.1 MAG: hypothetical protein DWQ47_13915 [Acidobacteriota bacterium]
MKEISRRKFLQGLGATVFAGTLAPSILPFQRAIGAYGSSDLHFLVVGDSLISGQGLREEDRFYWLTKNWLQESFLSEGGRVILKNKSHSGSNVYLNDKDRKALEDAERPLDEFFPSEVNFSFPSISTQVRKAAEEYAEAGIEKNDVGLVMVSGGITNITVKGIIDPFADTSDLRDDIKKYCGDSMKDLLGEIGDAFPKACIAVIGYYPMISPKSSTGDIYNAVLELYGISGPLKPVMNNIVTKQFFKILHSKMTKRSRIWSEDSDRELRGVVAAHNESVGREAAVFVESPIDESTCFATKRTLLWNMAKKGRAEDDMFDHRKETCGEAIDSMGDIDINFNKRFCELAGLGHPNREGAILYAENIKQALEPHFLAEKSASVSSS